MSLEPIAEFGGQHQKSGSPIAWIDTTGTIFLAAHEQVMPVDELYRLAREARKLLKQLMPIVRVVACPFVGQPGGLTVTERRRDFARRTAGTDAARSLEPGQPAGDRGREGRRLV